MSKTDRPIQLRLYPSQTYDGNNYWYLQYRIDPKYVKWYQFNYWETVQTFCESNQSTIKFRYDKDDPESYLKKLKSFVTTESSLDKWVEEQLYEYESKLKHRIIY